MSYPLSLKFQQIAKSLKKYFFSCLFNSRYIKSTPQKKRLIHFSLFSESNFLRNKSRRQSLAPKINGIEDDNIKDGIEEVTVVNGTISDDDSDPENDNAKTNEVKMTLNELISGALESAFWAMDKLIVKDREAGYRIR
jgi:hypothetical protein